MVKGCFFNSTPKPQTYEKTAEAERESSANFYLKMVGPSYTQGQKNCTMWRHLTEMARERQMDGYLHVYKYCRNQLKRDDVL